MTITTKKTDKGTIFTADGYSDYHRAYVQGAPAFTMFVPAEIVERAEVTAETAVEFCRDVIDERKYAKEHGIQPLLFTRGVRITGYRTVQ